MRKGKHIPGRWTKATMAAWEQGRIEAALKEVELRDRPFSEISSVKAAPGKKAEVRRVLWAHIRGRRVTGVRPWVRVYGERICFGYYRADCPWVLKARDFLNEFGPAQIGESNFHWISGCLFHYRPELIQKYIDKQKKRR